MKICIYGVGAIGGWIASKLLATDHQLSCVDQGENYVAIKKNGLCLRSSGGDELYSLPITDAPEALGAQDLIIVAVRSTDLSAAAAAMRPLLGEDTVVLTLCNGIPWWYFADAGMNGEPAWLQSIDSGGHIESSLGSARALGCIAYPSLQLLAPGVVEYQFGTRFTLGEPDGSRSARLKAVLQVLTEAGLNAVGVADIREKLWLRLMASTAYSLVSVPVGGPLNVLFNHHLHRREIIDIMNDIVAVAKAVGITPTMRPKELLDMSVLLGSQKTLMLQDMEAGRSMEIAALAVAIQEIARRHRVDVASLDAATAIAIEHAQRAGCYTRPQ